MSKGKFKKTLSVPVITIGAIGFVAALLLAWLIFNMGTKINDLKKQLSEKIDIDEEVKKRLNDLIANSFIDDEDVREELLQIATLIESHETKAVLSLIKVIEKLLKAMCEMDSTFKSWLIEKKRKSAIFRDYLDFAKEQKYISQEDFYHISVLKSVRNEEAHDLNVNKEKMTLISSFVCGFSVVAILTKLIKDKKSKEEKKRD